MHHLPRPAALFASTQLPSEPHLGARAEPTLTSPAPAASREPLAGLSGLCCSSSLGDCKYFSSPFTRLGTQSRLLGKYGLPHGPERPLEDWLFSIINGTTYHFKCIFVDLRKHHKGKQTTNKQTKPAPHVLKPQVPKYFSASDKTHF